MYPLDDPLRPSRPKAGLGLVMIMMMMRMMIMIMMMLMVMVIMTLPNQNPHANFKPNLVSVDIMHFHMLDLLWC